MTKSVDVGDKKGGGLLGHLGHFVTREKSRQELGVICVYPYIYFSFINLTTMPQLTQSPLEPLRLLPLSLGHVIKKP